MSSQRILFWMTFFTVTLFFSVFFLNSCGGRVEGERSSSTAVVALYVTDDISEFKQVITTIEGVQLLNTGTGASCDVLTLPVTVNLANLGTILQMASIAECPAEFYDRIHIEVNKSVELMSAPAGTTPPPTSTCSFVSWKSEGGAPNALQCTGPLCTLDINTRITLLAHSINKLALDFNLKEFEVLNFEDSSACAVSLSVAPLAGDQINALHCSEGVTGLISDLTPTDHAFTLTRGSISFAVQYPGIGSDRQPGLDTLLQAGEDNSLRVNVLATAVDVKTGMITANQIFAKTEGTVSNLNTAEKTFTLTFRGSGTITIDYGKADLNGDPADGKWVEAKLYGSDGTKYLASRIDEEPNGPSADD